MTSRVASAPVSLSLVSCARAVSTAAAAYVPSKFRAAAPSLELTAAEESLVYI